MNLLLALSLGLLGVVSCYMLYALRLKKKRLEKIKELAAKSDIPEFDE